MSGRTGSASILKRMWRPLRNFMVCLAALALPLQGMAGVAMGACHSGKSSLARASQAADQALAAASHAMHANQDHASHAAAVAGNHAVDHAVHQADTNATCSACAAGCCGAALRSAAPRLAVPAPVDDFVDAQTLRLTQAVLSGLERPPRSRLD